MVPDAQTEGADAARGGPAGGDRSAGRRWWIAVTVAWLATLGVSLALSTYTLDDSWITYRYARNLAEGHGLKWNPSDDHAFEAYTSFSHVLLTAGMQAAGLDPAAGSKVLGMGFNLVLLILLARFARRSGIPFPVFAGLAATVATTHLFGFHAVTGMDTFLYIAILTLATILLFGILRTGEGLAGFCLTLTAGALTRPDCAVLFAGYLAILWFLRPALRRPLLKHLVLLTLLPGALYAAFKLAYFGALLPNSFHFKASAVTGFLPGRVYVREFALDHLLVPFVFGAWLWRTKRLAREEFWALAALSAALLFYLEIQPKVGVGYRFLVPLLPSFLLVLMLPAGRLWTAGSRRITMTYGAVLAVAGAIGTALEWPALIDYLVPREVNPAIGRALAGLPGAESRVLVTGEAGAIPFYSRTRHLDLLGLVSKAGSRSLTDATWVFAEDPEILVTHSIVVHPAGGGRFELDREAAAQVLARPANTTPYLSYQILSRPEAARFRLLWKIPACTDPKPREHYYVFVRDTSDLPPLLAGRAPDLYGPALTPRPEGPGGSGPAGPGPSRP
ncbi:MAG: hypothetical protein FJ221_14445 [Lentisphaerae bacterium]|nr:hypothetical protein [Lentisphaerota bacterium]